MRDYLVILALAAFALMVQSCREGCKDKSALNYDSRASVENGTCQYCKTVKNNDTATYFFTSFSAPNPNANSVEFILAVPDSTVIGNGCQGIGKQPASTCNNYLWMVNLTNETITGSFDVEFDNNGEEVWLFEDDLFLGNGLRPLDTLYFGSVDTACSNLTSGTMDPFLNDLQFN